MKNFKELVQRVRKNRIDEVSKETMSSYMTKASGKNVEDALNLLKKGEKMSNDEYAAATAKIKKRDSTIRKVISKLNKGVQEASHDPREYDFEGEMTKRDLETIAMHIQRIESLIDDETNMPEWVQGKITLAKDYIQTVSDYLASEIRQESFSESDDNGYRLTNSWSSGGQTHKRWDKDHKDDSPSDRHQSTIEMWQDRGEKPVYLASHRIEKGYWTNQSAKQSPTKVTHKSKHSSLESATAELKKHTDTFYGSKK